MKAVTKRNKTAMVALAAGVLMSGWALSSEAEAKDPSNAYWDKAHDLKNETLVNSPNGPWSEATLLYVESAAQWDQAMARMAAEGKLMTLPAPQAPTGVNWKKEGVLLVATGPIGHSGVSVSVTRTMRWSKRLLVEVSVSMGNGGVRGRLYSPYHLLKVSNYKMKPKQTVGSNDLMDSANDRVSLVEARYNYVATPVAGVSSTQTAAAASTVTMPETYSAEPATQAQRVNGTWGGLKDLYR